uniref:NADH dehydrogenase subunit 6 n=1 Tax=Dosinia troscheli TaxID=870214 RepID=A0A2S1U281_9BIVA|nr:NADH dehydrogenase subunit 6 [Dosinia troscheli]AWI68009.1 NADH dehydrogenase subunit 6 [Dosinia troscheli]
MFSFICSVVELFVLFSLLSVLNFSLKIEHPLMVGMGLLSILVVMSGVVVFYGSLYSFCLFMVMVGGVLVVFSYAISLVSFSVEKMSFGFGKTKNVSLKVSLALSLLFLVMLNFMLVFESDWVEWGVFSTILYFSQDWGVGVVWMSLLLFLVMVFSVSVASKYSGALLK